MLKRSFDIAISLVLLILASPLLLLIALVIKLDSSGPVIFCQKRVGQWGEPFLIYKFRSMVSNAENIGPHFTSSGDKRITRVGRILRKTSLDEIPQLLNVLRGEMSLVGPRPNVYEQRSAYTDQQWNLRHCVKPGITGLAQATKRSEATPEERNELDLRYVQNRSFATDCWIILMTMRQALMTGGN